MATVAMFQPEWVNDLSILQNAIYEILIRKLKIELDRNLIDQLFDQESLLKYWVPAFTHKTVDPTDNYEKLEFYGDKVLGYVFTQYLRRRFGKELDEAKATLLLNKYMSTEYLAFLARQLGLPELMRYNPETPEVATSVQEDAFEAFAGALNNLSEDKIKPGLGPILIFNMLTTLFKDVPIKLADVEKDAITMLKEIYEKMGWGRPAYIIEHSDRPELGPTKATIRTQTGDILGVGYGSKSGAQNQASENALETLASQGVTWETADIRKLERKRDRNPEFERQYQRMTTGINRLNEQLQAQGKVPISDFRVVSIEQRKDSRGMSYTYSLKAAYQTRTGLDWKAVETITGRNNDDVQIEVMKSFANKMGVPQ